MPYISDITILVNTGLSTSLNINLQVNKTHWTGINGACHHRSPYCHNYRRVFEGLFSWFLSAFNFSKSLATSMEPAHKLNKGKTSKKSGHHCWLPSQNTHKERWHKLFAVWERILICEIHRLNKFTGITARPRLCPSHDHHRNPISKQWLRWDLQRLIATKRRTNSDIREQRKQNKKVCISNHTCWSTMKPLKAVLFVLTGCPLKN